MKQQFEKMMIMVQQALHGSNVNNNNGAQAIDPAVPDNNQDIIILGGYNAPGIESISKTVEKYSIVEGKSTLQPGMNLARAESASCVYNGDVIVTGGYDGQAGTDLIEVLKMNQHPLQWTMFDGKLPVKLSSHDVTVYQDKLYIMGGDNWNKKKISVAIYELSLAPPILSSFSQECLSQGETTERRLLTESYLSWEDRQQDRVKMPVIVLLCMISSRTRLSHVHRYQSLS
jgi:N-acetylneuraminic acid mutarotase